MLRRATPLACQEMVELITDYLEDTLPRSTRRRFEAHLSGCEHCSEYLAQMRATIRLTGRLEVEDLTPSMREDFAALFSNWRAQSQERAED